jgi:tetratricopeptide (TPR) repeat protein
MRLQPEQTFGTRCDTERFIRTTRAEYWNSAAVIQHALGSPQRALSAAQSAVRLDRKLPEAHCNLGVLLLLRARGANGSDLETKRELVERAAGHFSTALDLDPGFVQAAGLLGV